MAMKHRTRIQKLLIIAKNFGRGIIQDVKVTKDMLDLAKQIVNQKTGTFDPEKFEDHYETALIELIIQKRAGRPITPTERPRGENVVDLMDALRKSVGGAAAEAKAPKKSAKKVKGASAGQGDVDADRRQEAGEGGGRQEAGGRDAAEDCVGTSRREIGCSDTIIGGPHGYERNVGNDGSFRADE